METRPLPGPRVLLSAAHRLGSRRGFTVVECLVAGVVLAVFGASVVMTAGQSGAAVKRAQDRRAAAQRLDEVMTRIDLMGPAVLATEGPLSGELEGGYTWAAAIELDPVLLDLFDVSVTVSWPDGGRTRSVQAHTRLYDPVGSRTPGLRWEDLW